MYQLSHIQIKVEKIQQGVADFEAMGFAVERGGRKSRNAFIWFEQGPFIELLEMHRKDIVFAPIFGLAYGGAMYGRWQKWCTKGEGMIDFALEPSDPYRIHINHFEEVREEAHKMELKPSKVITWSRKNIKGNKVRFSYLPVLPQSLPFLVSAYDVPQRPKRVVHGNAATRIIYINVSCKEQELKAFEKLAKHDPSIRLRAGEGFKINSIGITGIKQELPKCLLHNAVIERV